MSLYINCNIMTRISIAYCTVVSSSSFLHRRHMDVNVEGPSSNNATAATSQCQDAEYSKVSRWYPYEDRPIRIALGYIQGRQWCRYYLICRGRCDNKILRSLRQPATQKPTKVMKFLAPSRCHHIRGQNLRVSRHFAPSIRHASISLSLLRK